MEIIGRYATAVCYARVIEEEAVAQITDIILNETSYQASQLNIIEVKA